MAVIAVPRPLREKLGEEGTDALVALINEAGENTKQSVIEVAEERFERRLAEELGKLRAEIAEEMSKLRVELSGETSKLRVELSGETSKLRTELSGETSKLRAELSGETSKLRTELSGETSKLRAELSGETSKLRAEMHDLRASLIQWMFVFWIGQIGVLVGFLFTFLKK
jgi:Coiled-coil domain-containing protein 90-like